MSEIEHHPTLAPSMLPALSQCSCYSPDKKESPEQSRGTRQHLALKQLLEKTPLTVELSQSELQDVNSAVNLIRKIFDLHEIFDNNFFCEKRIELLDSNFDVVTFGTVDVLSKDGSVLIDFKSSDFNHVDFEQQINCYAYIVMETYNLDGIHTHIVYPNHIDYRNIQKEYAKAQFQRIYNNVNNPNKQPIPCDYCHQCKKSISCEAFFSLPIKIGKQRDDYPFELGLSTCHASQIQEPETMARLLQYSTWLEKFIDSVKYHAKEMELNGKHIPGYYIQECKGHAEITDIDEAKKLLQLTEEEFLGICKLNQTDLVKLYSRKNNMSEAKAKMIVEDLLAPVLLYSEPIKKLVKERKPKQKKRIKEIEIQPQEEPDGFDEILESKK